MKTNHIACAVALATLISCSVNKESEQENMKTNLNSLDGPVKWKLISMSGNIANQPPATGSNMSWQESYVLNADNTFTKTRNQNNTVTEASGRYTFVTASSGEQYFELTYTVDSHLIGNCSMDLKEVLIIQSEDKLTGTWSACDGPGLVYKKVAITE